MGGTITRKNIRTLSTKELDDLVRAFHGIQQLSPHDPNSFFIIAGYHGEPFRGAGYANPAWWGGYCNHGNVLFPTWHRGYLLRLEKALQSQVPGVALPYWDETEKESLEHGIPPIFLQRKYKFSDTGKEISNPLFSYTFQARIEDRLNPIPDADYTKPVGYETVRYPFSGLVGPNDKKKTWVHNNSLHDMGEKATNKMLNDNITTWLTKSSFLNSDGQKQSAGVKDKYYHCLDAPNYTVFSNTTSAQQWNDDGLQEPGFKSVTPLESPHNLIHLAVGGFDLPGSNSDQIGDANGDMGENDTAAFDPIFYFHHCFIDLMFWRWQKKHNKEHSLEIIQGYPGTNSVDNQGPTPGVAGGTWLTLDSPLDPFRNPHGADKAMTSRDVVNIAELGYAYDFPDPPTRVGEPHGPSPVLTVSGINRAAIGGSFVVSAWATLKSGEKVLVGTEAVLSRWHVSGCKNCQNHLEVRTHIPVEGWTKKDTDKMEFEIGLHTRNLSGVPKGGRGEGVQKPRFSLETDHL